MVTQISEEIRNKFKAQHFSHKIFPQKTKAANKHLRRAVVFYFCCKFVVALGHMRECNMTQSADS